MILLMHMVSNTSPIWNLASIERLDLLHDQHDEKIWQALEQSEIPNDTTLKAFAEDKINMPVFEPIAELREDIM